MGYLIKAFVLLLLVSPFWLFADFKHIYVVKDPYPSKLKHIFNHSYKYKVEASVDNNNDYWYAITFLESFDEEKVMLQLAKATGTANSGVYDCEANTNCSYYISAIVVEE